MKRINGPTILTLIRIVLVVPIMATIFQENLVIKSIAVCCFLVAAITDFVDGRWARSRQKVTDLGIFLDPLADKMLVNLTFLCLVVLNVVPIWLFAVILVRDFAVDGMRMLLASRGEVVAASKLGKTKTMLQMITLTLILMNLIFEQPVATMVSGLLLYVVLILTIWSGADYLIKGWKVAIK